MGKLEASHAQEKALESLIELRKQNFAEARKLEKQRSPMAPSNALCCWRGNTAVGKT